MYLSFETPGDYNGYFKRYIPTSFEHPSNCIKGVMYSLVWRWFNQNIQQQCLPTMSGFFTFAFCKEDMVGPKSEQSSTSNHSTTSIVIKMSVTVFFHLQFNTDGISRQDINKDHGEHLELVHSKGLQK